MTRNSEVGPDMPLRPDSQIQTASSLHAICCELSAAHRQDDADALRQHHLVDGPGSFGLTRRELWAEGHRLLTDKSWQQWEIRARLVNPRDLPERGRVR